MKVIKNIYRLLKRKIFRKQQDLIISSIVYARHLSWCKENHDKEADCDCGLHKHIENLQRYL